MSNYPAYSSMPSAPEPVPGIPSQAPGTVRNAVILMYARAALGLISIFVLLATKSPLKTAIHKDNPNYDASKLDNIVNAAVISGLVVGIIFLVLYVLLAVQVAKGKNWARIVTWVISGLGVLSIFGVISNSTGLTKVVDIVSGLLAIAIIVLLAMGPSNQYFATRMPR